MSSPPRDASGRLTDALALALAHDLSNYLTAILNLCAAARVELPPGPATEILDEVRAITETAAELTAQARALRPDDGERADLRAVLEDSLGMLNRMTGREVDLVTELPDGPCRVPVGRTRLEQLLTNLTLNARDAEPVDNRVTLTVRTEDHHAVLEVVDRGSGMTPEVRERATEPFFTTKPGRGTGLGLAIVRMVTQDAEGQLQIESEPGQGTVVRVIFPLEAEGARG